MLTLGELPLFSQLLESDLMAVREVARVLDFTAGALICRKGDPGRLLLVIASGGVRVMFGEGRGVFLAPGQVIGELSIISGLPVSASIYAVKPTRVYAFEKDAFLKLLEHSPVLHRTLSEILADRLLRAPSEHAGQGSLSTVFLVPESQPELWEVPRVLFRRIAKHTADAVYCTYGGSAQAAAAPDEIPFDCAPGACGALSRDPDAREYRLDAERCPPREAITSWRAKGVTGQHMILAVPSSAIGELRPALRHRDAVVPLLTQGCPRPLVNVSDAGTLGEADVLEVRVALGKSATVLAPTERWSLALELPAQGLRVEDTPAPGLSRDLDFLARWSVRRGIGIALGAGAARGFAHLGVLKVLEEAKIPMDFFAGTSIGGIVALVYNVAGSADGAIELLRQWMGARIKVFDGFRSFHSAFYPGKKIKAAAQAVLGDVRIESLPRPVSVVAADLTSGEKVVMDHGPADIAALATSAIPGIFPPIWHDGRVLIDGAPVSRVPVDVLNHHRCRLKIAVNVSPQPHSDEEEVCKVKNSVFKFLGFRNVWLRSWEVQAYWDGVRESSHADILLEPAIREFNAFDFDLLDELLELGKRCASEKLESIEAAVSTLLSSESL